MERFILPIGSDVEVTDPEAPADDMPIYSGGVEDAFMSIEPGLYPFVYEVSDYKLAIEGWPHGYGPVNCVLVVTLGESFAVTTAVEYDVIHQLVTD